MAIVRIPGFGGVYVLDTGNGGIARVGSNGGLRNPLTNQLGSWADFREVGGGLGTAALGMLQEMFPQQGGGGGGAEDELLRLQIDSINRANAAQEEIMARENARRKAYNRYLTGERFTPTNMEEDQGILAARSSKISAQEQERLQSALEGKLPVNASTTREINENRAILNERLRRNLGPGYESSEPGAKELTRFDESASMLEEGDRRAYIERGIQPSITAAQFAQDAVGQYVPQEVPGLAAALAGLQRTRLGEGQLGLGYAQLGSQEASDYIKSRKDSKGSGFFGSGLGRLLGAFTGGALGTYFGGESKSGSGGGGGGSSSVSLGQVRRNASSPDYYGSGSGFYR